MPDAPRRRFDFTRLPALPRYALALAVLAVVVALVLLTNGGDDGSDEPAGWYTAVVRIGAVALLAYVAFWLARRVARGRRRP